MPEKSTGQQNFLCHPAQSFHAWRLALRVTEVEELKVDPENPRIGRLALDCTKTHPRPPKACPASRKYRRRSAGEFRRFASLWPSNCGQGEPWSLLSAFVLRTISFPRPK